MSAGTELLFIFFGLGWIGLSLIGTAVFIGCRRIFRPTPKPTDWEDEWQDVEKNLNK